MILLLILLMAGASVEQLINTGRLDEARVRLELRIAADGRTPDIVFLEAMILHREKRYRESLEKLAGVENALRDDPRFLKLSGLNLVSLKSLANAGPYFRRAVEVAPKDAMARYYLGLWLVNVREPLAAEAEFRRSLVLDASRLETHFMLGLALEEQGRAEEALAAYTRASDLADQQGQLYEPPHLYAGRLLYTMNRIPDSVAQLRRAALANPNSVEAHLALGKSLEAAGDLKGAGIAYDRCVELAPKDRRARYRLMRIRQKSAANQ